MSDVTTVYELSTIVDVKEYEGFAFAGGVASVRGKNDPVEDFRPDWRQEVEPHVRPAYLSPSWRPARVTGNVQSWHDFPCIDLTVPAFSRRAVDALRDLLASNGELLPLSTDIGEYYAYNVTTIEDALDLQHSEITWGLGETYISSIQRYEFDPELVSHLTVFRLPQQGEIYYVTESFAQRIRLHRLQGFDLSRVWPLAPGEDWWETRRKRWQKWRAQARSARRRGLATDQPPLRPYLDY